MVVGKSSSRVNEEMGRVPIWKLPDMTHKILLGKERKGRKFMGKGKKKRGCTQMGLRTI
jgi:hypothetical protein